MPTNPTHRRLAAVILRGDAEADRLDAITGIEVTSHPATGTVSVAFTGPGNDRIVLTGGRTAVGKLLASACKQVAMIDNPGLP